MGLFFNDSIFSETLFNTFNISRSVRPTNNVKSALETLLEISVLNISKLNWGVATKKLNKTKTNTYETLFKNFLSRNRSSIYVVVLLAPRLIIGKTTDLNNR